MRNTSAQIITVSQSAADQIKRLLDQRGKPSAGIRIGVKQRGCSGNAYTLEYADEKGPLDEEIQAHGITIFVDPKAILFVIGTEMDFVSDQLESGFKFKNPNEKGRCGCGESFHV